MRQPGGVEIIALGPLHGSLRDPVTQRDVKSFVSMRLYVRIVDAARAPGLPWVEQAVTKAVFAEILACARRHSASLLDVMDPAILREVESNVLSQLRHQLADVGMAALAIDTFQMGMDAQTAAWLKAQLEVTPRREPARLDGDEPTELASRCVRCSALTSPDQQLCPACGGSIAPPGTCRRCRSVVRPGSRFCSNCGTAC